MHYAQKKRLAPLALLAMLVFALLTGCGSLEGMSSSDKPIPKAPSLEKPVVDQTDTLTDEDITNISKKINNSDRDKKQPQIAVLMVDSIPKGKDIESASLDVARKWGIGGKDEKNGVLLYVAKSDHELRIEVADGVSDKLTDVTAKRIIDDVVAPKFKDEKYAEGITDGTSSIRAVVGGKNIDDVVESHAPDMNVTMIVIIGLVVFVVIVGGLIGGSGRRSRGGYYGGYYGGGSSGGSSGFGGGGGFTGGGASGRW